MMDLTTTDELVRQLGSIPNETGAAACFGTPVERDGHTLIPVARVAFGYGLGFGRGSGSGGKASENGHGSDAGEGEGGGGGGGGSSTPVAVIDITSGDVKIQPIVDASRITMTSMMVGAWLGFWLLWTIRTIGRDNAKTERIKAEKGLP